jgi:hypothetical protein
LPCAEVATGAVPGRAARARDRPGPPFARPILAVLLGAALLAGTPSTTRPADSELAFDDARGVEFALLAVRLDGMVLSEAMPCYQTVEGTLVPLGALCELLGLAIQVDPVRGVAEGFFIREGRRFLLDTRVQRVRVEGRERTYDPQRVRVARQDILVETGLLATWLPIDLVLEPYEGLLRVRPREPLPLQQRWVRQQRIGQNRERMGAWAPAGPLAPTPRTLWDMPFTDQTLTVASSPSSAVGNRLWVQHTAYLVTELLYSEVAARLTQSTGSEGMELHGRAARRDPDGGLLGPLHAREVAGGEIVFPGQDLLSRSVTSDGVIVSNFPLSQPTQFDQHTFQGSLPPGWEVELYRNGAIIAYRQADASGMYAFENVPLLYGRNVFQRVFYGPHGQRRAEDDVFEVGRDLTPPGESWYRFAASGAGSEAERSLAEWNRGLTKRVSTEVNLASIRLRGTLHRYGVAGLSLLTGRVLGRLSVGGDAAGGRVASADVQTRRAGVGMRLRHTRAEGFHSDALNVVARRRGISVLRVDAVLHPPRLPRLPLVVEFSHDHADPADGVDQVVGRLAGSSRGLSVSNQATWTRVRSATQPVRERSSGQLLVNRRMRRFSLRGELEYRMTGSENPSAVSLVTDLSAGRNSVVGAGVRRELDTGRLRYQVGYQRSEGRLGVGIQSSYIPGVGFAGSVQFTLGLNREPRTGAWSRHARPIADAGAVSAGVFLDANGNGVMDPGETPIEDADLLLENNSDLGRTDSAGVAFVSNLAGDRPMNLSVAPASLADPQWILDPPAVQIVPRAGKVSRVDFAVLLSGEVAGTVRMRSAAGMIPAAGVTLELVPVDGTRAVRVTRSDYDGFYNFAELRPGYYTLRVPAAATQRRGLGAVPERALVIDRSGPVLDGVDFLLEAAVAAPVATAPVVEPVAPAPVATAQGAAVPVAAAPVVEPVAPAPVATAQGAAVPVAAAPVVAAPVVTAPVVTAPVVTAPVAAAPRVAVGAQRHATPVAAVKRAHVAPVAVETRQGAAPAAVGTRRTSPAGANASHPPTVVRRGPEPSAAHRESFLEMLWRIVKTFVKRVVRAVGIRR